MARTDTLPHFLTDVADAIRTKGGTVADIQASSFDTAIANLPSGGIDWSEIGYTSQPTSVTDGINYAKTVLQGWPAYMSGGRTNMSEKFKNDNKLVFMPMVDTSTITNMSSAWSLCKPVISIPSLDFSHVTTMADAFFNASALQALPDMDLSSCQDTSYMCDYCFSLTTFGTITTTSTLRDVHYMFDRCIKLVTAPLFNTAGVQKMSNMFSNCTSLENIPLYNTSSCTDFASFAQNVLNLTDTSLDNILQMCANSNVTNASLKKLTYLGITTSNYSAARIQALPHYQDFINAGWVIS